MDMPTNDKAAFDALSDGKDRELAADRQRQDYDDIIELIQFIDELRKQTS